MQETLFLASRDLANYCPQGDVPFYAWLRQIAWRQLLRVSEQHMHTIGRSVLKERPLGWDHSRWSLTQQLVTASTPSKAAMDEELEQRVCDALDELPERDREVLVLRYLERLRTSEIAATLGVSETAVRMRSMQALEHIRHLLWDLSRGALAMSHSVDIHAYRADDDEVLARLIEQVNDQMEAGESVDLKALTHEHPEHEARLRNLLPAIRTMVKLGDMPLDVSVPAPTAGGMESQIPADKRLGDYEILEEIGRGGMGVVYRARQLTLGRVVALKILPFAALADPRHLQRFHNEARAIATLHHPHIVPIHSYGVERGVHYYAMEYVEGATLAQVLEGLRERGDPSGEIDRRCRSRHHSAHSQPSRQTLFRQFHEPSGRWGSAVFDPRGHFPALVIRPRLFSDGGPLGHRGCWRTGTCSRKRGCASRCQTQQPAFGFARTHFDHRFRPGPDGRRDTVTLTGDVFGTLRYMSPEQADGRFADPRTDVYSLGVTLYELLTLRPPFQGERRQELLKQIAWQEPPRLRQLNPAIPRELETIVGKALAKEAGQRYATAKEMADDLRCFLENRPLQARPPTLIDRAVKWLRRHPGLTVATLVTSLLVMLTAGVSTAVVWRAKQEAESARARAEQKEAVADQKRDEIRAVMDFLVKDVLGSLPEPTRVRHGK